MERVSFTVSYPADLYKAAKTQAAREERNLSDLVREAVDLYLKLDPTLLKTAKRLAAAFKVSPIEVIQNAAIRTFALNDASIEVHDRALPNLVRPLVVWEEEKDEQHLMTGDQLYQNLKQNFIRRLKENDNWKDVEFT